MTNRTERVLLAVEALYWRMRHLHDNPDVGRGCPVESVELKKILDRTCVDLDEETTRAVVDLVKSRLYAKFP